MLATDKQMPLYDELWSNPNKSVIAGGAGLNSARGANYFLCNQGL